MGIRSRTRQTIPAGTIWMHYGTTAPPGWLYCDGQSTAGYPALAAEVGANVPDLRGRSPMGAGTGSGLTARTLGTTHGTESHTMTTTYMPSHNHGGGTHTHGLTTHTHTGINHGHSAENHGHNVAHDHGPHAHSGTEQYSANPFHDHQAAGGVTAGNPGGYFTGVYSDTYGASVGVNYLSTGGPSTFNNDNTEMSGPANADPDPTSGTVISLEGSGTPITHTPPVLALQFIIKT